MKARQARAPSATVPIPTRLETPVADGVLPPPVKTGKSRLPLDQVRWDNFERLCLRLARTSEEVEQCRFYGNPGDAQHGIDLYAKVAGTQKWRVYQCKHVQKIKPGELTEIVNKFLDGDFADTTGEFVLCTNQSLRYDALDDAWRKEADKLQARIPGIKAVRWDVEEIVLLLHDQPRLVFDFFGPLWFEDLLGRPPQEFTRRLTAEQVASFRSHCRQFYEAHTDRLDSGLPMCYPEESVRLMPRMAGAQTWIMRAALCLRGYLAGLSKSFRCWKGFIFYLSIRFTRII